MTFFIGLGAFYLGLLLAGMLSSSETDSLGWENDRLKRRVRQLELLCQRYYDHVQGDPIESPNDIILGRARYHMDRQAVEQLLRSVGLTREVE